MACYNLDSEGKVMQDPRELPEWLQPLEAGTDEVRRENARAVAVWAAGVAAMIYMPWWLPALYRSLVACGL